MKSYPPLLFHFSVISSLLRIIINFPSHYLLVTNYSINLTRSHSNSLLFSEESYGEEEDLLEHSNKFKAFSQKGKVRDYGNSSDSDSPSERSFE